MDPTSQEVVAWVLIVQIKHTWDVKPNWPPLSSLPELQLSDIKLQHKKQMKTLQYVSVNFMFFWFNKHLGEWNFGGKVYVSIADSSSKSSTEFLQLTML